MFRRALTRRPRSGPSPSAAARPARAAQSAAPYAARRLVEPADRQAHGRRHRQADLPAVPARAEPRLLQEVRRQRRALHRGRTAASAPRTRWPPGRSTWPAPGTSTRSTSSPRARTSIDVVQLSGAPGEREMCGTNSGVHSAADFKGKTLGVTDLGSGTDELTQFLAAQKGISRQRLPHRSPSAPAPPRSRPSSATPRSA